MQREDVCLLYADIGNRLFNTLKSLDESRVINAGIAEANMAGMAAGMAMNGLKPFIFTITPFTTSRNFEQIKIDIAYQNLPVVITGTGSGLAYASLGPTHHSFEDVALMRSLPNMTVLCPADTQELEALFPSILKSTSPIYLRIGKKNEPVVHKVLPELSIGHFYRVLEGADIGLLSCGNTLPLAEEVAVALSDMGISVELMSCHTVKPLDANYLEDAAKRFKVLVTIEEHSLIGGFGSAVAEFYIDKALSHTPRIIRFGLPDRFIDQVASQEDARKSVGLDKNSIVATIMEKLRS